MNRQPRPLLTRRQSRILRRHQARINQCLDLMNFYQDLMPPDVYCYERVNRDRLTTAGTWDRLHDYFWARQADRWVARLRKTGGCS